MKINTTCRFTAVAILSLLLHYQVFSQKKNYISIEGGIYYGGAINQVNNQMNSAGFGDDFAAYRLGDIPLIGDIFTILFLGDVTVHDQYPKISKEHGNYGLRYGRQLKNGKFVELSFGQVHNSTVTGLDIKQYQSPVDANSLIFSTRTSAFTANYILADKKNSLGIGAGLALAFDAITRTANGQQEKFKPVQPGISGTAYWRFINGKIFFMTLRTDALLLAPATLDAITLTSEKGEQSKFPETKINSFIGDVTISAGIKF